MKMIHSNGILHTYYLEYYPEDTSIRLILHLCPSSSSILPSPVCYSCIHVMKDMDCVLMCQTTEEERKNRLLILSSTLQLRGIYPNLTHCRLFHHSLWYIRSSEHGDNKSTGEV